MAFATFFCFFALVACLFKGKEKKPRKFSVCVALCIIRGLFLHLGYSAYLVYCCPVKVFGYDKNSLNPLAGFQPLLLLCLLQKTLVT